MKSSFIIFPLILTHTTATAEDSEIKVTVKLTAIHVQISQAHIRAVNIKCSEINRIYTVV